MKDLWRTLGIVGALLLVLVYLLIRSASPDLALRKHMVEQLKLFELRDAEITRDVMLTRAGLLPNYDALMDDRIRLQEAMETLRLASTSGTTGSGKDLEDSIARLSDAMDKKLRAVEHFKTDDALLRTSTAYLTYTISRMRLQPGTRDAIASGVSDLAGAFLRFIEAPSAGSGADFKAALDHLGGRNTADEDLHTLVVHGGLVVELLPQAVAVLRQIVAAPTTARVLELHAQVEKIASEAERRAQVFRYLLFFVSLLLLAYVVSQFARLRASARNLRISNDELSREVGEREQAETALRASEERFRAITESAHDAIISADSAGKIVSWNPGAAVIFGYRADEILGTPVDQLMPTLDPPHNAPNGNLIEATGRRKDGSEFPLEASSARWLTADGSFVSAIVRDVSARKQLEETARQQELRLVQADKLAALGTLVSGVAHEINNPNQMVLLNSSVLADTWRDACIALDAHREQEGEFTLAGLPYSEMRDAASTLIRDVNEGAMRIERIVQDLKDFSRPQRSGRQAAVEVNDVIQRAMRLLAHLVKRCHNFQLNLAQDLPQIRGNAQQVEQVFVNLIVNALQALPNPSCAVTVTSRCNASDGWVVIEVRDEGVGIEAEHLERLCEPFFTTKQRTGGTGLGLSVTFSLVQAHSGRLEFASEVGRGTRATVSFPPASRAL